MKETLYRVDVWSGDLHLDHTERHTADWTVACRIMLIALDRGDLVSVIREQDAQQIPERLS